MKPATFQALSSFDRRMTEFLADLRAQKARRGQRVMAPEELEVEWARLRARLGIPIDRKTWADFERLAEELDVAPPSVKGAPRKASGKKKR